MNTQIGLSSCIFFFILAGYHLLYNEQEDEQNDFFGSIAAVCYFVGFLFLEFPIGFLLGLGDPHMKETVSEVSAKFWKTHKTSEKINFLIKGIVSSVVLFLTIVELVFVLSDLISLA